MVSLTIRSRLGLSLVLVLALVLALGAYLLRVQARLDQSIRTLGAQAATTQMLSNLQLLATQSLMPANDYIITADQKYVQDFSSIDRNVELMFAQLLQKGRLGTADLSRINAAKEKYAGLKRVALEIFSLPATEPGQPRRMETMDYDYGVPMIEEIESVKLEYEHAFAAARAESAKLRANSERVSFVSIISVLLVLLFVGLVQVRSISSELGEITRMLAGVAEGRGDLTQRLDIKRRDEVGRIAELFNQFVSNVHGTVCEVVAVSRQVMGSARRVQEASRSLHDCSTVQVREAEAAKSALEGLQKSVTVISADAGELSDLATHAAAATDELSASFDEVTRLTEQLDMNADTTLLTVDSIKGASEEVARNVNALLERTDAVVTAVNQVRGMAGEIVVSARDQAQIARDVQDDATRLGLSAITETAERMERLRQSVGDAAEVLDSLGKISGEIGRIVSIISEVTGKTNLLALNASIIAAQSGEYGKSFAVVADEVKALATRTAVSTREIEQMVEQVRDKTNSAINAVQESVREAEAGVRQAQEVACTFTTILQKTAASQSGAELVAANAEQQSEGVEAAMGRIEEIRGMVGEIRQAAEEQSCCAEAIVRATRSMRDFTRSVRDNVDSQSDENMRITKISQEVFARVQVIAETTHQQEAVTRAIAASEQEVLSGARSNQAQASLLDGIVGELDRHAAQLEAKVGSFKV